MLETENSRANVPEKEKLLVVELGEVVATPGALETLKEVLPLRLLGRHQSGDGDKVWIITKADRSVTTILLPKEY